MIGVTAYESPTRSADCSEEVPATFREALKEVPASEGLRACTFFDYFICINIPVVMCKLDLVFCF